MFGPRQNQNPFIALQKAVPRFLRKSDKIRFKLLTARRDHCLCGPKTPSARSRSPLVRGSGRTVSALLGLPPTTILSLAVWFGATLFSFLQRGIFRPESWRTPRPSWDFPPPFFFLGRGSKSCLIAVRPTFRFARRRNNPNALIRWMRAMLACRSEKAWSTGHTSTRHPLNVLPREMARCR